MVTEQETFCFYDSSIWTPSLTPPAPCSNGQTAVTLTPASLAFPPHPTGTTSAPLQATLTNTGGAALVFTSLGRPGDFYGSWNCPRILQPGASCTITVAITPSAAGTPRGTVLITDNAPGSHQKAAAGGYGVHRVELKSREYQGTALGCGLYGIPGTVGTETQETSSGRFRRCWRRGPWYR